ncbi:MAG TPA: hypothetical protein VMU68_06225 [Acidimicrobiales bacterium]|nr:hypothetical protein [Acidimicrobiales bacterium]
MAANPRIDDFAELADFAVLSDGRTSALRALDGQVDWWAMPVLDDLPPFGALLDPAHGGHVFLRPQNAFDWRGAISIRRTCSRRRSQPKVARSS